MGKIVALIAGAAVLALVVTGLPTANRVLESAQSVLDGAFDGLGAAVWAPSCELALADGGTIEASPEEAAALTTAAATGAPPPVEVDLPPGITPQSLALSAPEGVTCRISQPRGLAAEELTETGLTPRAQAVNDAVQATFGRIPDGGYAPGGISTGHGARSAHYDGRAVDLFFRPVGDEAQRARGWAVANWLVAHAQEYGIAVIIFDDRIWSTRRSAQGWRPYSNPDGYTNAVGRHLDHVHVDVIEGSPAGQAGN